MKRETDEITGLFRSRLGNAEMTVRDGFWEELNKDVAIRSHRRRVAFFRVAAAASVLLVLAASSATIWFISPKEEIEQAFTQLAVTGVGDLDGDHVNQSFSPVQPQPMQQKSAPNVYGTLAQSHEGEEDDSVTVTMSFSFSVSAETIQEGANMIDNGKKVWKAGTGNENFEFEESDQPVFYGTQNSTTGIVKKYHGLALKAGVGTALPAANGRCKMPVMAGLTLEKRFNKYLGIETGLAYTNLRSEGKGLHYLGIPVKMNVYLAEAPKLDLYASLGGIADKCIAGAAENDFKNEPVQLAVIAGLGVNYKLNDRIALFAEPGVSHHFKTDSKLETVRTKRPTNFNLICGLRMTY